MTQTTLKPGGRLFSTISATSVVVVRPPTAPVALTCGGAPMADTEQTTAGAPDGETLMGKRYTDPQTGLEVLCTRGGAGGLAADGRPLDLVGARALPASD